MTRTELDEFTKAYIVAALWSSVDENGDPMDNGRDIDDCSDEFIQQAIADCNAFREQNEDQLTRAQTKYKMEDDQLGHDFWLTRNHHGAGFWDRGMKSLGGALTDAAQQFGECDLYIGDDGKVYCS